MAGPTQMITRAGLLVMKPEMWEYALRMGRISGPDVLPFIMDYWRIGHGLQREITASDP